MEIIYRSIDGFKFSSEADCLAHENKLHQSEEIYNAAKIIEKFCLEQKDCELCMYCHNGSCAFSGSNPMDWDLFGYSVLK